MRVIVKLCPGRIVGDNLVTRDPGGDDHRTADWELADDWPVCGGS
jgi:hypothetical protein